MLTVEEYVQRIVESNRGNEEALVSVIAHEIHLLHAALPTPSYLESVAAQLEVICVQEMDLPDGETFNGPEFLRNAAQFVRLIMNGEMELKK
jgi:chorismate mutase